MNYDMPEPPDAETHSLTQPDLPPWTECPMFWVKEPLWPDLAFGLN